MRGIWSIDGIHPLEEKNGVYVVRLVHLNDVEVMTSGVRYVFMHKKQLEEDPWGRCVYLNSVQRPQMARDIEDINFDERVILDPDLRSVEESLRGEINQLTSAAREAEGGSFDNLTRVSKRTTVLAKIHVHNVGQGDTVVIELPGDQYWMIDSRLWGNAHKNEFEKWMKKFEGKTFSKLIVSHMHYDHIYSVPYIIDKYSPDEVVVPDSLAHSTATSRRVVSVAGLSLRQLSMDQTYVFGDIRIDLVRSIQFSNDPANKDPNYHEIGVCITTPKTKALLAGDMPAEQCEATVRKYLSGTGKSYYKVSHHGSRTGYSTTFMDSLNPKYSVISCGTGNRYSHPHNPPLHNIPGHVQRTDWMPRYDVDTYDVY